ncbi:DUF2147 domain-containing protein [Neorhizobium galegae]|nr:DUF2147 domain-containing protein [Neorhizobium galegae]
MKGIVFLNDLKWDAGDRRWEGCSLYSGATGRTVSARVTLVGEKMELSAVTWERPRSAGPRSCIVRNDMTKARHRTVTRQVILRRSHARLRN